MTIDDLVSQLSSDAHPVQHRSPQRAIWLAIAIGGLASIGTGSLVTGMLPTLLAMRPSPQMIARVALGLAFGAIGVAALLSLLRPGTPSFWISRGIATTSSLLLGLFAIQVPTTTLVGMVHAIVLAGPMRSPLTITGLSVPVFVALIAVVRREAPTHLNLTGAALGLISGGIGGAAFFLANAGGADILVLAWYSIGIGAAMLGGLLAGPRLLRW